MKMYGRKEENELELSMGIFGKKKLDEFEDEEDVLTPDEELKDRKLTRKFRDLNPENKKQRKEPLKPWGKKERLIVLFFFLATTLIAMLMFLTANGFKFPSIPKINFSEIKLNNPFSEQVIEIGNK